MPNSLNRCWFLPSNRDLISTQLCQQIPGPVLFAPFDEHEPEAEQGADVSFVHAQCHSIFLFGAVELFFFAELIALIKSVLQLFHRRQDVCFIVFQFRCVVFHQPCEAYDFRVARRDVVIVYFADLKTVFFNLPYKP